MLVHELLSDVVYTVKVDVPNSIYLTQGVMTGLLNIKVHDLLLFSLQHSSLLVLLINEYVLSILFCLMYC